MKVFSKRYLIADSKKNIFRTAYSSNHSKSNFSYLNQSLFRLKSLNIQDLLWINECLLGGLQLVHYFQKNLIIIIGECFSLKCILK